MKTAPLPALLALATAYGGKAHHFLHCEGLLVTQSGHDTLCNKAYGPFSVTSNGSILVASDILRFLSDGGPHV